MTAIFAEHVLVGDVIQTCQTDDTQHDTMIVDCIHWTEWGIMFHGQEVWSERVVCLLPVPATSLVEVWSA